MLDVDAYPTYEMKLNDLPDLEYSPLAGGRRPPARLGDLLVAEGVLSQSQLDAALAEAKRSNRRLGDVLVDSGIVNDEAIARTLGQQLGLPFVDLTLDKVSSRHAKLLSEPQARRFRALPLDEKNGLLRLAMADPTDLRAHDEVQRLLQREVEPVVVSAARLRAVLDRLYARNTELSGLTRELELEFSAPGAAEAAATAAAALSSDDAPVAKLLTTLFDDALRARASDIHIEPLERKLQVRFRVDGVLKLHTEAEARITPALVQRLKLTAGLDIAEKRLPQDGRFHAQVRGTMVDMRISTMPTQFGESVVLRLLPQGSGLLALDRLGMPTPVLERVREFISRAHGMLLVTGPTGSGKTTTLYGALAEMNSIESKIITVEDPVEYRLPGVTQIQVHEKIGLSFATVLRSTLRQDPDIVLVGEMRDRDTVETGLRAAMTGHMVLSTLHTNDAASTPMRLLDMGAPRFLVASSLQLVLAQRLVRAVCPHCRAPHAASAQERVFLAALGAPAQAPLARGAGCGECAGTGFLGRHAVYELLDMDDAVVEALNGGDTGRYLAAARAAIGPHSLAQHALQLVLDGATTVREAMRIAGRSAEAVDTGPAH